MCVFLQIVNIKSGVFITSIDKNHIQQLGLECRRVLMNVANSSLTVDEFKQNYQKIFNKSCAIEKYTHILAAFIRVSCDTLVIEYLHLMMNDKLSCLKIVADFFNERYKFH